MLWHDPTIVAGAPRQAGMDGNYMEVRPGEPVPVVVFSDYV
ncbi:MAG TPA: hypothetical protein PLR44_13865 [Thermomicrobiales bacterium]|jgi:hypothetical protein|nr:hypothetical protein [Thermomicrobiales bacterium]